MTDTMPGLHQAADAEKLRLFKAREEHMLGENRQIGQVWSERKQEYEALRERLVAITSHPSHEVMVPLGKKAFMPGRLVHTNEILVLLGENLFVERSAKQAVTIVDRRIASCASELRKRADESRLFDSWKKETDQLMCDLASGEGATEIREPYDAEEESRWREEHRKRVREYRAVTAAKTEGMSVDDDELWRKLEQLEIEEELDEHLAKAAAVDSREVENPTNSDDVLEDWPSEEGSEETSESDESSDADDAAAAVVAPKLKRRVSFGDVTNHDFETSEDNGACADYPTKMIEISHSEQWNRKDNNSLTNVELMTPADLGKRFVAEKAKKSILKPFDSTSIKVCAPFKEPDYIEFVPEQFVQPVGDFILEKELSVNAQTPIPPSLRKPSKFKQSRLDNK